MIAKVFLEMPYNQTIYLGIVMIRFGKSVLETKIALLELEINTARNEALSYHTHNIEHREQLRLDMWEGNQKLLDRLYSNRNNEPVRVVFLIADTSLWDVYASIHELMRDSKAFIPITIAFPRQDIIADKDRDETKDFFNSLGIKVRLEGYDGTPYSALEDLRPDIIFYTLGSVAYPDEYKIEYTSLFCRTCYLSYGFLLAKVEEYQFDQSFHHAAWTVYASTNHELERYRHYQKRRSSNAVLTGYPKFDQFKQLKRQPVEKPVIIWAPHWTIGLIYPALNYGTFDQICNDMLVLMRERSDLQFIFKPHPNLAYALNSTNFMDEKAYLIYLDMLETIENVEIWKHGNYFQLFVDSSAMITDSVSFLAEYLPSKQPLLFMDREDRAEMSEVGEQIIQHHYRGRTMEDIQQFIEQRVIEGDDPRREDRLNCTKKLLNIQEEPSSEAIINHLHHSFALVDASAKER